ncbi:MAG: type II secretion system F family protein [Sulfitobacter sp.]
MLNVTTAIFILAGLGLAMLGTVAVRLIFAPENAQDRARANRLKALDGPGQASQAQAIVQDRARDSVGRDLPLLGNLTLRLRRAGLDGKAMHILVATLLGGLVLAILFGFYLPPLMALPLGLITGFFLTHSLIKARHQKRVDALTQQLPDALDLMMRGLRVGHPVNATIANVARTMPDPIGAEFRILSDQIAHGDYLTDAFNDLAERVGQEDVDYLAVSINIQHGTGGNLAEMLGTLSKVVRDRIIMRRRIKAISSEGRMSAWVLSSLPLLIYVATSVTNPDYYGGVSDDPMFLPIVCVIVALVVANFLTMRKLVTFDF